LYIIWIYLDLNLPSPKVSYVGKKFRTPFLIFFAIALTQTIYGAFVAGLKAGWVNNTYPLMDGQIITDAVFAMDPTYLNFLEGKSGVQFIHRTLALILTIGIGVYYFKGIRTLSEKFELLAVRWSFLAVLIQFALGVSTLMLQVPIELAILHQLGALLLLASLLFGIHRFRAVSN
jgi:cytochrome c oxidase assembly protein subunit 15